MPLDPCQDQALGAFENQKRITSYPYYSKIKFVADRAGEAPGPFTYTINAGSVVRAFSYAVGDNRQIAGYTAADGVATFADTNMTARNQTTGGQNVIIHGVAVQPLPVAFHIADGAAPPAQILNCDWKFLAALWNSVSVHLSLNGDENNFRMGIPGMIPGAGGLTGSAPTTLEQQRLAGMPRELGYPTNAFPAKSSFFRLGEGLIWRNQSNADSMLNLVFNVRRAIRLNSGGSSENAAFGVNTVYANAHDSEATGEPGYNYPSKLAVECMCFLIGQVLGPRTRAA
jgi:hypothetical protein